MVNKLCKRGHVSGRDMDGHCSECRRRRLRSDYANNLDRERERGKNYRNRNRAKMLAKERDMRLTKPERNERYGRKYREANPERTMLRAAAFRAKEDGYACTITEADIFIPEFCPLLGMKLQRGKGVGKALPSSPSLDKIIPALGYVPGNVMVISYRANSMKRDATLQEMQQLVSNWTILQALRGAL